MMKLSWKKLLFWDKMKEVSSRIGKQCSFYDFIFHGIFP